MGSISSFLSEEADGAGAGGFDIGPKKDAKALVAPDADGETDGAAGPEFEFVLPDVGVPKVGMEGEELGALKVNEFEPDPNPLKLAIFGTGGTYCIGYQK